MFAIGGIVYEMPAVEGGGGGELVEGHRLPQRTYPGPLQPAGSPAGPSHWSCSLGLGRVSPVINHQTLKQRKHNRHRPHSSLTQC